jgi:hypothetical protein
MLSFILGMVSFVCLGVCLYFKQAIGNAFKLKKMMKKGYIICRLKRIDKTEMEIVTIPNKELNGVRFPNIEGIYTLDNASVILKERKYPVYEWREGETAPINYENEYISTKEKCPNCEQEAIFNILRPKSMSPSVLDNIVLKIKTLNNLLTLDKLLLFLIIGAVVIIIVMGANAYLTYDLTKKLPQIITPVVVKYCTSGVITL